MQTEFEKQLESAWPSELWKDHYVLVGVSGGADSVALLRSLVANSPAHPTRIVAAHFNHRWRGNESDADATFVERLSRDLGIESVVGHAEPESNQTESNARQQRYAFLENAAEEIGARYVTTAHTADDQAETVLHRIIRGTGIGGLRGIPRIRVLSAAVTIVRPLLRFRRHEVEAYLDEIGQSFRHDSSNDDVGYTRNRIRNELMPQLRTDFNANTTDALLRLSELASQHQQFLLGQANELFDSAVIEESDTTVSLNAEVIQSAPPLVARELFVCIWNRKRWPRQAMGAAEWQALADFACQDSTAMTAPGNIQCRRRGTTLQIERPL